MAKGKFYVVWKGHKTGVFKTWNECKRHIDGFKGAEYKSFLKEEEANEAFIKSYEDYKGKVNIYKVDTEAQQELSAAFAIRSIPSMLFCPKEGQPQMAQGALPKQQLEEIIKDVLKASK